jgi:hypothetical protein
MYSWFNPQNLIMGFRNRNMEIREKEILDMIRRIKIMAEP